MAEICIKHIRKSQYDYVRVSTNNTQILDAIEQRLAIIHECPVEELRKTFVKRTKQRLIIHDVLDLDDFTLTVGNIYDALKTIPLMKRRAS